MSAFLGASPQELESLANVFLGFSQTLDTRRREINTRLHTAGWEGDHADQFRAEWNSKHYPLLTNLVAALVSAATTLRYEAHQQDVASGVSSSSASSGGLLSDLERDVSAVAAGIAGMARGVLGSGERALQHVEQVLEGDKKPAKPPATTKPSESAAQIAPAAVAAGAAATFGAAVAATANQQATKALPDFDNTGGLIPGGAGATYDDPSGGEWCADFVTWVLQHTCTDRGHGMAQKDYALPAAPAGTTGGWSNVATWVAAAQPSETKTTGMSLVPAQEAQAGDLVVYPDDFSVPQHIGIVTSAVSSDGHFASVQGNFDAPFKPGDPLNNVYSIGPKDLGGSTDFSSSYSNAGPPGPFAFGTKPEAAPIFIHVQPPAPAG